MTQLIKQLWRSPPAETIESIAAWWRRHQAIAADTLFDTAVLGGLAADRVGYAFASGYQAAGQALFGATGQLSAMCATEGRSAHPASIKTSLTNGRVSGRKSFVTFGAHAEVLVVVCSVGEAAGRNQLKVVRVRADQEGVQVDARPPTPFAPEIPHAAVTLQDVVVDEVLPGDGYADYLKPFRTVEDIHVFGAVLGYLFGLGRAGAWDTAPLLTCILALRQLATGDPRAAETHVGLGAALLHARRLVDGLDWGAVDPEIAARWRRDRQILDIAGQVRAKRFDVAQQRLSRGE